MLATRNIREFIAHNDQEFRCLVNTICHRYDVYEVDDAVQDAYAHIMTANILERYDPNRPGSPKISTYLYPIITNLVLSKKKESSEIIRQKQCFHYTFSESSYEDFDTVDLALRFNEVASEWKNILHQNDVSDSIDGLGYELRDFQERFLPKRNKLFTLAKRKRKEVRTNGCRLSDIYELLFEGLSNKEIAEIYGVSYMYVTAMKRELAYVMQKGGTIGKPRSKRKLKKRVKNGRNKVSKM